MTHDAKLGKGLGTGMFYHAPAGTALPESPLASLGAQWTHVGDVSQDGISLNPNMSATDFKNWANRIVRSVLTESSAEIPVPVIDTTEESLKTVVGAENVTVVAASSAHGKLVKANLSLDALPEEEAYLFLMKDGDDAIAIGCTHGQIKSIDAVAFQPYNLITWTPTITALGDGWQMIVDDGQTA